MAASGQMNPFEILNIPYEASGAQVKAAYRQLAKQWHPDLNDSIHAASRFRQIHEAYKQLSDDHERQLLRIMFQDEDASPQSDAGPQSSSPGNTDTYERRQETSEEQFSDSDVPDDIESPGTSFNEESPSESNYSSWNASSREKNHGSRHSDQHSNSFSEDVENGAGTRSGTIGANEKQQAKRRRDEFGPTLADFGLPDDYLSKMESGALLWKEEALAEPFDTGKFFLYLVLGSVAPCLALAWWWMVIKHIATRRKFYRLRETYRKTYNPMPTQWNAFVEAVNAFASDQAEVHFSDNQPYFHFSNKCRKVEHIRSTSRWKAIHSGLVPCPKCLKNTRKHLVTPQPFNTQKLKRNESS